MNDDSSLDGGRFDPGTMVDLDRMVCFEYQFFTFHLDNTRLGYVFRATMS